MRLDAAGDGESLGEMRAETTQKEIHRDAIASIGPCNCLTALPDDSDSSDDGNKTQDIEFTQRQCSRLC